MILGIDFGASTANAVLLDGKKVVKKASFENPLGKPIGQLLEEKGFKKFEFDRIAITGGKSSFLKEKIFGLKPVHIDEIKAVGLGAFFLSKKKTCLAVSMGTGTCIVFFEKGKARHVTGTGVGGGTVLGLSRLLLNESRPGKLAKLASKGKLHAIDLSVKEIIGKGVGLVPGNATASNFGKAGKASRQDTAAAIQNMAAESVARLALSASKQCNCSKIVFLGKTTSFPFVKKRLNFVADCFNSKFIFPKDREHGSALGAALALQKRR